MMAVEQLDFEACVCSGQVFRFRFEDGAWRGVDGWNLIEARQVGGGWELSSSPDGDAWRKFVQADVDLLEVRRRLVESEPRAKPIIEALPGLRTLRPERADETLFSFLCTPNNHMSRIVAMARYLASQGNEVADGHHVFPEIARIAELSENELRANGFGYRGATIPAVAKTVLAKGGVDWLEGLRCLPYEEARVQLMSLPGIGPKLADCVCLFGLHFDEAVPVDTHVWKTCQEWDLAEFGPLTPKRYEQGRQNFVKTFGTLSGWAQQYVFYERFLSYRRQKS